METKKQTPNARKQAAFVARKAESGLYAVRGIFAFWDDHAAIKTFAKILTMNRTGVDIDAVHKQRGTDPRSK